MSNKKIFILLGHSNKEGSPARFANAYQQGAKSANTIIRRIDLCDIDFDPILYEECNKIQELEPGLQTIQKNIKWCNHFVIIYPMWWGTMPAILKGMIDRVFLPGFAFTFDKKTHKIKALLKGKSAHLIMLCERQAPWKIKIFWGDCMNEIKNATLKHCGFRSIKTTMFGPVEFVNKDKINSWLKKLREYGYKIL